MYVCIYVYIYACMFAVGTVLESTLNVMIDMGLQKNKGKMFGKMVLNIKCYQFASYLECQL